MEGKSILSNQARSESITYSIREDVKAKGKTTFTKLRHDTSYLSYPISRDGGLGPISGKTPTQTCPGIFSKITSETVRN